MRVPDYLTLTTTFGFAQNLDFYAYLNKKFGIDDVKDDFYNLPFTPDLIIKFFKGYQILKDKYNEDKLWDINSLYTFEIDKNVIFIYKHLELAFIVPKFIVINDFIIFCKIANIVLEL